MIAELLAGRRAARILVGVGPGSFTGIRVGIAAAHGLAIGWDAELHGLSSLAFWPLGAHGREVAAAIIGGHGQLFVQSFDGATLEPTSDVQTLDPSRGRQSRHRAAGRRLGRGAIGRGARIRRGARGLAGRRRCSCAFPTACARSTPPGLCPGARRQGAGGGVMASEAIDADVRSSRDVDGPRRGDGGDEPRVRRPIRGGLDPLPAGRDPPDGRRLADPCPRGAMASPPRLLAGPHRRRRIGAAADRGLAAIPSRRNRHQAARSFPVARETRPTRQGPPRSSRRQPGHRHVSRIGFKPVGRRRNYYTGPTARVTTPSRLPATFNARQVEYCHWFSCAGKPHCLMARRAVGDGSDLCSTTREKRSWPIIKTSMTL